MVAFTITLQTKSVIGFYLQEESKELQCDVNYENNSKTEDDDGESDFPMNKQKSEKQNESESQPGR